MARAEQLAQAVAERLRLLLKERDWNQTQLADSLQLSRSAVSFLINKQRRGSSLVFYVKLAHLDQKSLGEFFIDLELQVATELSTGIDTPAIDQVRYLMQLQERWRARMEHLHTIVKQRIELLA